MPGTQLAAEDLIGVPRIIGEGDQARSRFCPPEAIARDEPYVLLHLGFDHLAEHRLAGWNAAAGLPSGRNSRARFDAAWNLAACVTVNRFLAHLKIGRPPAGLGGPAGHEHLAGAVLPFPARGPVFRFS